MHRFGFDALSAAENCDFIHGLLEQRLARDEVELPTLPEAAAQVLRAAVPRGEAGTHRPADEHAEASFTIAVHGRLPTAPGQHHRARRYRRHALASALWSRRLAGSCALASGEAYLGGLLHEIGRPVTLSAVQDLAQRTATKLSAEEYDRLVDTFQREVGARVLAHWGAPESVAAAAAQWQSYESAGPSRVLCNLVNVAHRLADCTLAGRDPLAQDLLADDPAFADLGFAPADAPPLFAAADSILAEVDGFASA